MPLAWRRLADGFEGRFHRRVIELAGHAERD
jgi:hypothetical protein